MAGAHASAGVFSITAVEFFDDIHAFDDVAEGDEAGFDVVAGGVIAEVDEDLRGPGVRSGVGEGDVTRGIVLFQRVVGNGDAALLLGDGGVSVDSELNP